MKHKWKLAVAVAAVTVVKLRSSAVEPVKPPPDAVASCGPIWNGRESALAWATYTPSTGLHYYFATYDRDGRPHRAPVELGWGYEGASVCVLGWNRGRYLAAWPWVDPYGGSPELRVAIVDGGREIHARGFRTSCWELRPVDVTPRPDGGWILRSRCGDDGPIETRQLDRNGR